MFKFKLKKKILKSLAFVKMRHVLKLNNYLENDGHYEHGVEPDGQV